MAYAIGMAASISSIGFTFFLRRLVGLRRLRQQSCDNHVNTVLVLRRQLLVVLHDFPGCCGFCVVIHGGASFRIRCSVV